MTLAIGQFPQERHRDAKKGAVRRWRAAQQLHTTGVVSRAQQFPLRPPLAPQASRNTYQTRLHQGSKKERSTTNVNDVTKGKNGGADARFELRLEAALPA